MAGQSEEVEVRIDRIEQTDQETMSAIQTLLQKFASIEARFHDKGPPGFPPLGKLPEQVNQETVTNAVRNFVVRSYQSSSANVPMAGYDWRKGISN